MVSSTLSLAWPRTGPMVASSSRRSVPRLDSFMVRGGVAGPPPGSTAPSSLCDTLLTSCSGFYIRVSKYQNKIVNNCLEEVTWKLTAAHRQYMSRVLGDCVNCWSPHGDRRCPSSDQRYVSSVTCAACAACAAPMAGPSHAALGGEVSCPPGRHITHQHQPAAIAGLH